MSLTHPQTAQTPAHPNCPAVVARGVEKSFGETQALRGCSFSARRGELHAIVGENGSGKSTLAKILSGVLPPDGGEVRVLGRSPQSPRDAHGLGIATVFQEVLVADGASVLDNLYIGMDSLWRRQGSPAERARAGAELLDRLIGQPIDLDAAIETLSLSQRQWVTVARALLRRPQVLILDESTAALDLDGSQRLLDEVVRLRGQGVCVLLVTHRIAELTAYADRATVLRDGVEVATLNGAEISERRLLELMSGDASAEPASAGPVPALDGQSVRVRARGLRLSPAARAFDLDVRAGEILGVAGLEGHGQSEFLRAVAGIATVPEGRLEALDDDGRPELVRGVGKAARLGIVYIPGDRKLEGIFPNLSVLENFGMALYRGSRVAGLISMRSVRRRFRAQAEALSVQIGSAAAPITTLSGGNQQKVIIGRALALEPRIVALNDPTRGVDIATKRDLYDVLRELAADGRAVVFLSTEIEEFLGLCHRVAVFRDGTLSTTLATEEITFDGILAAMFARTDDEATEAGATR